jgi:hypothetical protein
MWFFFGIKSSFQNCFWNLFITSGLSQICIIRNVWKLPSPIAWLTLIKFSEKTSRSLKTSFWKKNYPTSNTFFITDFEFIRTFFTWNDVFKFQEVFSENGIRSDLEVSRHFLLYRFETNQRWWKHSKNSFENYRLKTKETTYTLVFGNTLLSLSEATQQEHFQCFWKIYWKISQDSDSAHQN